MSKILKKFSSIGTLYTNLTVKGSECNSAAVPSDTSSHSHNYITQTQKKKLTKSTNIEQVYYDQIADHHYI